MMLEKAALLLVPVALASAGVLTAAVASSATSGAAAPWSLRLNAGGPAFTDSAGRAWAADDYFVGGTAATTTAPVDNAEDQTPYRSERYGLSGYRIPVPRPGIYTVTLSFADSWATAAGQRVFSVAAEGQPVVPDLDLLAAVGPSTAYDVTTAVRTTDAVLDLDFAATTNNALVNGIQVVAAPSSLAATTLTSSRLPAVSVAGARTTCTGRLTRTQTGAPVVGAPVVVWLRPDFGPSQVVTVRTGSTGVWAFGCAPVFNTTLRASFAGDADDAPATATAYRTGVAPRITVAAPVSGALSSVAWPLAVRGTISPNKAGQSLGLYQLLSTGQVRRLALGVVARDGSWRMSVPLARGDYRLKVAIGSTPGNIQGSTAFVVRRR
jgi:hypothetical protein